MRVYLANSSATHQSSILRLGFSENAERFAFALATRFFRTNGASKLVEPEKFEELPGTCFGARPTLCWGFDRRRCITSQRCLNGNQRLERLRRQTAKVLKRGQKGRSPVRFARGFPWACWETSTYQLRCARRSMLTVL